MKRKQPAELLLHDSLSRQRNIVYPDTVRNQTAGYRHLLSAPRLTWVERIGAFIDGLVSLLLGMLLAWASFVTPRMVAEEVNSRAFGALMIIPALCMMGVAFVFVALGFKVLKRSVRR